MTPIASDPHVNRWLVWAFALAVPYAVMILLALLPLELDLPDALAAALAIPAVLAWVLPFIGAAMACGGLVEARALRGEFRGAWMGWFALAVFVAWLGGLVAGRPLIP